MRIVATTVAVLLLASCANKSTNEALGTLERDRIVLKATANEIILEQPVPEGTKVTAGTLLVQLDDTRQQAVVARAQARGGAGQGPARRIAQWRAPRRHRRARAPGSPARAPRWSRPSASYQRAKQLLQQKLAAQATLDQALANRDSAEAALQSAQEELLRLTNGTRQEQLDQGAAALQAADGTAGAGTAESVGPQYRRHP